MNLKQNFKKITCSNCEKILSGNDIEILINDVTDKNGVYLWVGKKIFAFNCKSCGSTMHQSVNQEQENEKIA